MKSVFMAPFLFAMLAAGQSTPARKYHDAEKDQAVQLTQISVDTVHDIWALRNGSSWFLKSVSFECDTSESSDEHFTYLHGDGSLIAPWHDKHTPRGKKDPWGVAFPESGEVVRHLSGMRQDLLDVESAAWYIQKSRLFNCRVTDVDFDHKEDRNK